MKKAIRGVGMGFFLVSLIYGFDFSVWTHLKIQILLVLVTFASVLQPDFSPFEFRLKSDGGTAFQIIWSVYFSQFLGLFESLKINFPESMTWNAMTGVSLTLAVFGLLLRSWSVRTLGKFFTWHVETQSHQKVVTTGPYRYLRHPSYTGAYLTYVFCPLFIGAPKAALASVFILGLAFIRRIKYEEALLLKDLGSEYAEFCRTRKRLLPFIW
jgi:protein-S-isoprenylcysteine O-methyltransferase